jgi:hypothetical protein
MGTCYYRIPQASEMDERKLNLMSEVSHLDLTPDNIERNFCLPKEDSFECESVWDVFLRDINVHLGKRSFGWKFCWNFHNNKYYSNKEELLTFIRSGRVVDEYGDEWNVDEFIKMAFEWGEPDGLVVNEEYRKKERMNGRGTFWLESNKYDDLIIDGLRVSTSTEFS